MTNPASLARHDPAWATVAARQLGNIRSALVDLPGAETANYDHIGSTSVPGLAAKPYLDLQVRILPLAEYVGLDLRLSPHGFERAQGSRPDSPGVTRDIPRGDEAVAGDVWEKRLYFRKGAGVILHIRRSDSPWGWYTVWFRDWLRAHPKARLRYETTKRELAEKNVGKPDYDDYTRAKTAFFDEVHHTSAEWAQGGGSSAHYRL